MDSLPTQATISGIVVDLWTVISVYGPKATVWFRMGDESNHEAFRDLIPQLDLLTEEDAQGETDIVNTLFTRSDALRFVEVLLSRPDMGTDHRIVSINNPGMRVFHQRHWAGEIAHEFYPFGDWDPFSVNGVDFPRDEVTETASLRRWN
jgi:hypothetical protein